MLGPLVVLAPVPAQRVGRRVRVSRKFVTGMQRYARLYPGPVQAILLPGQDPSSLDSVEIDLDGAGFEIHALPFDGGELRRRALGAGVVLGGPHHHLMDLSALLRARGVPYVLCTEYTLRTRLDIVRAEVKSPVRAARRALWEVAQELRTFRSVRQAAALQCNGTPTYEAYRALAHEALLYFDNRVERSMVPSVSAVRARAEGAGDGRITLVYSGRLHPMKGVEQLPEVAAALVRRGVAFELHVFGEGPLGDSLRARVRALGLESRVIFRGVVDFAGELVPWVREHADLFVCCHPQGDPSCTYVETLACGVPIVGYANEAFAGLLREVRRVGVAVAMNDPDAIAGAVERYALDRAMLVDHSLEALAFASEHLFEETFERRVEQLARLAARAQQANAARAAPLPSGASAA